MIAKQPLNFTNTPTLPVKTTTVPVSPSSSESSVNSVASYKQLGISGISIDSAPKKKSSGLRFEELRIGSSSIFPNGTKNDMIATAGSSSTQFGSSTTTVFSGSSSSGTDHDPGRSKNGFKSPKNAIFLLSSSTDESDSSDEEIAVKPSSNNPNIANNLFLKLTHTSF
ncbi:unnamed protein product [Ambrosiozyma monospora]|uniref:Unnamed protein product n=1 Tax=Ambrosiozyma monospora TaxID=43982 RepID=A0ACB5TKN3_AMBMO|nr:unnamed protein product [Ambrosiozyma monospora]